MPVRSGAGAPGGARAVGGAVHQAELREGGSPLGDEAGPLRPRPADEAVKGVHAQTADESGSGDPGGEAAGAAEVFTRL